MSEILIVEDNEENYFLLAEILSEFTVQIDRAASGKEFHAIMAQGRKYDLVLMDLMLPDSDGIELSKCLIDLKRNIPIVFISAYAERCEEIYALGVKHFIQKPVISELFLKIVNGYTELIPAS